MANYSVLIEARISATNIDALNRSAKSTTLDAVAGGNLVSLAPSSVQGDDVYVATEPTGTNDDLWMAYNPAGKYIKDANGNVYAGLSEDPRAFATLKGETLDVFRPQVDDEIVITSDGVDDDTAVAGNYFIPDTALALKKSTTLPQSGLAFKVKSVDTLQFPPAKGAIGLTKQKAFHLICVQR